MNFSRFVVAALISVAPATLGAQAPLESPTRTVPSASAKPVTGPVVGYGPNGATLRCRDGSYPAAGAADSACEGKGGVAQRFPVRRHQPGAAAAAVAAREAAVASPARQRPAVQEPTPAPPAGFESAAAYRERMARSGSSRPPEGATLLCNNGTYIVRDTVAARCGQHGGVQLRFPSPPRRP